jgi:TRAP-type C4-dicarboxylate transport system permease small subunit
MQVVPMAHRAGQVPSPRRPAAVFGWLIDGANALGSVLIILLMLLILSDVASRGLFNRPLHGVSELVGMSVIIVVFAQLASSARHGRMARAEIFIDDFRARNPRAGAVLQSLWNAIAVLVCAIVCVATVPSLLEAWRTSEFIGNEGLFTAPVWPMRLAVVLGSSLTAAQYGVFLWRSAARAVGLEVDGYDGGAR